MGAPTSAAECDSAAPDVVSFDRDRLLIEMGDLSPLRSVAFDALHHFPRFTTHLREAATDERLESLACFARRLAMLCSSLLAFDAAEAAEMLRFAAEAADLDRIASALDAVERELERLMRDLADTCDIVL